MSDANAEAAGLIEAAKAAGNPDQAEQLLRDAVRLAPGSADANREMGRLLMSQGRSNRAAKFLEKALQAAPDDIDSRYMLAAAMQQSGSNVEFERHLLEIVARDPAHVNANNDLGCLYVSKGKVDAAEQYFRSAAAAPAATAGAHANLGFLMVLQDRLADAAPLFDRALELEPENSAALSGAATVARRTGKMEKALALAEKAVTLNPRDPNTINLLGSIQRELGDFDGAEMRFREALDIQPAAPSPRANLGLMQLLKGDWHEGWRNAQARLADQGYRLPGGAVAKPWTGEDPAGKSMMVYVEQGFGDTLQFARFLPKLADMGATVRVAVQPAVRRLIQAMDPRIDCVAPGDTVPPADYQVLLLDAPLHLGIDDPAAIDGRPYLPPLPAAGPLAEAIAALRGFKVGINWRGNPSHKGDFKRSIPLEVFSRLIPIEGVTFVNLSVGNPEPTPDGVADFGAHLKDFADTASLIAALDLVISVDTATVHLAGALGTPCWTLISYVPDWRWGLSVDTTPWYDGMTLFRQTAIGDWESVIARVADALRTKTNP